MNSDTIWFPEINEETILYIVKKMKKSVFTGLDHHKEEAKKSDTKTPYSSGYDDSKWECSNIYRDLSNCQYRYVYKDSCGWNVGIDYRPFDVYSYESGSAERKFVETLCRECKDETIAKVVMTRLLNEWKLKEEKACRQKRIERKAKHISSRLDETKEVQRNVRFGQYDLGNRV